MKTPNIARRKVILITPPVNVLNIRTLSEPAPVMTIISNVMPKPGVKIMDIIQLRVLFLNMLTNNARTENLITNNAKPIMTELARNSDIQKPARPVRNFIKIPDVALMILLTGLAAHRPDAPVIPLHLILLTVLTAPTDANMPAIIPVIWTARLPILILPTRPVVLLPQKTDAGTKPVTIPYLAATRLLPTGAPFMTLATEIAAPTELSNPAIPDAAVPDVLPPAPMTIPITIPVLKLAED